MSQKKNQNGKRAAANEEGISIGELASNVDQPCDRSVEGGRDVGVGPHELGDERRAVLVRAHPPAPVWSSMNCLNCLPAQGNASPRINQNTHHSNAAYFFSNALHSELSHFLQVYRRGPNFASVISWSYPT
eukprot:TRINITY_DN6700_c0_g1_i1.p1 TRINITY_DN6700_c0_g1~~TRINITY_DN6700_c0_g1_i1.p1  ORF type:complete len:131 (+),score=4.71 TRINITY_DN6700_c0_g1_i1:70-462(+)